MTSRKLGFLAVPSILILLAAIVATDCTATARRDCRWQYKVLDTRELVVNGQITAEEIAEMARYGVSAAACLEEAFDTLGADGWEMVSFADEVAVFKRPGS